MDKLQFLVLIGNYEGLGLVVIGPSENFELCVDSLGGAIFRSYGTTLPCKR